MQYRVLTVQDQMDLLTERIGELEREHFRATLRSMETEGVDPQAHARDTALMASIEARIVRHVGEPDPEPKQPPEQQTETVDLVKRTAGPAEPDPGEPSIDPDSLDPASGDIGD